MPDSDPVLNADDLVEVSYKGEMCGQTILTIMHYRLKTKVTGALTAAMDDFANKLLAATKHVAKYRDAAAQNYTFQELVLQAIEPVRFARFPYVEPNPGTIAVDGSTADLAAVIEFSTPFITHRKLKLNRGQTGGIHFAAVPMDRVVEGLLTDAYMTGELNNLGSILIDDVTTALGNVWRPVLYHRNDIAPKWTDITRYHVLPEARVMRRRTVGRGI